MSLGFQGLGALGLEEIKGSKGTEWFRDLGSRGFRALGLKGLGFRLFYGLRVRALGFRVQGSGTVSVPRVLRTGNLGFGKFSGIRIEGEGLGRYGHHGARDENVS